MSVWVHNWTSSIKRKRHGKRRKVNGAYSKLLNLQTQTKHCLINLILFNTNNIIIVLVIIYTLGGDDLYFK